MLFKFFDFISVELLSFFRELSVLECGEDSLFNGKENLDKVVEKYGAVADLASEKETRGCDVMR